MQQSKTERALCARTATGAWVVLATDGEWLGRELEAVGCHVEDIRLFDGADDLPGLLLWTGIGTSWPDGEGGCDLEYEGDTRPVTLDELVGLLAMAPPAPPELPPYEA